QGIQHDYRQVFATLLQDWLGANNWVMEESMFQDYAKVPLVGPSYVVDPQCYYGGSVTITDAPFDTIKQLRVYPNPARSTTEIMFTAGENFPGQLSMHSMGGSVVYNSPVQVFSGDNQFYIEVNQMPPGMYFVRLENRLSGAAQVAKVSVVR
ncbi:MAG: T9SS type A sorting domain-containing protein, partial [Saprospiraceae bacterium]|nr:T9SS type A sorting domain-containing protein [Saprospiraceae bacterium]